MYQIKQKTGMLRTTASLLICLALTACGGAGSSSSTSQSTPSAVTTPPVVVTPAASDPLMFSASSYSVAQSAGSVTVMVVRTGSSTSAASVDFTTADGTAKVDVDYTASSGTLSWAENDATAKAITIPLNNAMPFSGNKTFSIALSNPSATAEVAAPDNATVTISGGATMAVGALQFSASAFTVAQDVGSAVITVNRTSGASGAVAVNYATSDGTAITGTDYTAARGTLNWADGDATAKSISVAVSNATPFSGNKSLTLTLSTPTAGATVGNLASTTLNITGDATAPVGNLRLSVAGTTVQQSAGKVMVTVNRAVGSRGAVSVNYSTVNGSAVAGTDYVATNGTLSWNDGDVAAKSFAVSISNSRPFVGNKSFTVGISNPTGGATISNPSVATNTIAGDGSAAVGNLQLSAASFQVAQSAGDATISVTRSGGSAGTVSVAYATKGGSAVSGVDFTAASGVLQWADGDASAKTISVPVSNTTPFSGTKSFSVTLSSATGGATLGSPGTASVAINGSAAAATGSLQLSAANYSAAQNVGSLVVTVNRTGGSSGAISVNYSTANGSAAAGTDYTAAAGTLNWADGDSKAKTFSVAISNAVPFTGTKTFSVAIASAAGGATLSTPTTGTVTITGGSAASVGTLKFATASYPVGQSAGTVTLTVNRVGGSSGVTGVNYATADGTAAAGSDYTAVSGALNWQDGDTSARSITVTIGNSVSFAGTRSFTLALSNPSGGGAVGTPGSATVSITGSGSSSSGGTAPGLPSNVLMMGQGANSISLAWTAAAPGGSPVSYYKIYRNGVSIATATGTSYTDNSATNATNVNLDAPANIYGYAVSAVDAAGNEGPRSTQTTARVYGNGVYFWTGDYSYGASIDYKDTSGGPQSGPYDIAVTVQGQGGGFQPYAGNVVPLYDLEAGSFGYFTFDLKPTRSGQKWRLSMISRLPPGDVYPWAIVNISDYGPAPVAGQWATYKVPLSKLSIGNTSFTGSISGTTLTVTSVASGVGVDAGGFITGPGVKPGTYITGFNANGGPGTYTIYPAQNVASTAMVEQRTTVYKFDVIDDSGASSNKYYVDNVKFTTN